MDTNTSVAGVAHAVVTPGDQDDFLALWPPEVGGPPDPWRHRPEESWLWLSPAGRPLARCSLWFHDRPHPTELSFAGEVWQQPHLGLIGHYAALDAAAGTALLQSATERLIAESCTLAVGPMDGSTWQSYRFVTDGDGSTPFTSEPHHPADWPDHFLADGFRVLARYYATRRDELETEDPRLERAINRLSVAGVRLRPMRASEVRERMLDVYHLISESFAGAYLGTPIDAEGFARHLEPLLPLIRPGLVWGAEHDGNLVGLSFAFPDVGDPTTVISKTLAVKPGRQFAGLGLWLLETLRREAYAAGYRRMIHALMHEENPSLRLPPRSGRVFRTYALLGKDLRPGHG